MPTRQLAAYAVLACAVSWAWWVPMAVAGQVSVAGRGWPTHLIGLTGPALAALVVTAWTEGAPGVTDLARRAGRWRVRPRWWLLVVATLALSGLGLLSGWGGERASLRDLGLYSGAPEAGHVLGLLVLVMYVLLVNGLGEEVGWRGFLADRLLRRYGPLRASTLVWVIWAVWHAPLFFVVDNFRDFGPGTLVGWLVGLWFGSYLLTRLYVVTGRSVLLVACWHTAYNVTTATEATAGTVAAVSSTLVIAVGAALVLAAWRERSVNS